MIFKSLKLTYFLQYLHCILMHKFFQKKSKPCLKDIVFVGQESNNHCWKLFLKKINTHHSVLFWILLIIQLHDDAIKWKHFPCYWPFVRGIHQSLVNSPHKGQWCRTLLFFLNCTWTHGWVNNRGTGDLRRNRTHYDVIVMDVWSKCSLTECM